jgi:hypothetical protein
MDLVTDELKQEFPRLYETEDKTPEEVQVIAKFFNPVGAGTWFAVEFDPEERIFFGYVNLGDDDCAELGYFSLDELEAIKLPGGLTIERDRYFGNHTLAEVMEAKGNL